MKTPSALILSGEGRYADPWHPFRSTTVKLATLLDDAGYDVRTAGDVDVHLAALAEWPDLLVVNLGLPRDGAPVPGKLAAAGLRDYLRSGGRLLGMHVSSTSFTDLPEWEFALGGRWVRGETMHPDQSEAHIKIVDHRLTRGMNDFSLNDERYSYLKVASHVQVLATHEYEGREHPIVWVKEADDVYGRSAYDALGHDANSYESAEHFELLGRLIAWLGE